VKTDSLDPSDPSKCSCSSDSMKERFDPDTKSKVDKLMVDNQQKEENEKDWAKFYYQWKNLKKFSTAMHWGMLYFDFIVGLFLVLIVLDFNVKSYKKINVSLSLKHHYSKGKSILRKFVKSQILIRTTTKLQLQ